MCRVLGSLGEFKVATGGFGGVILSLDVYKLKVPFVEKVIFLVELPRVHGAVQLGVYWSLPSWLLPGTT